MEVRRVTAAEWRELRDIRLGALAEAPAAFAMTYDDARARPDTWWVDWARAGAESEDQALALAWEDGAPVGVAGIHAAAGTFTVISMWTDPAHRGRGIACALLDALIPFAGDAEVMLSYVAGNDAARRVYERYGFVETGETEPLRSDASLLIHHMRLDRSTGASS